MHWFESWRYSNCFSSFIFCCFRAGLVISQVFGRFKIFLHIWITVRLLACLTVQTVVWPHYLCRLPVISYPGHFVPTLVISYLLFGHFVPNNNHFVPRSFRTQVISYLLWSFRTYVLVISYPVTTISYPGHFVPILVISYLGQVGTKWLYGGQFVPKSFRTLFGHFVPILVISYPARMYGWMDWRTDGRTDGQACFDWNDKLTSYS